MRILSLCACLLLGMAGSARADVIFDIEDLVITPGQTAQVGVFLQTTAGETVSSYNLPIDVGNNSFGLPAGVTSFSLAVLPGLGDSPGGAVALNGTGMLNPPFIQNYDGIAASFISPTSFPAKTRLFTLNIGTDLTFTGTPIVVTSNNFLPQFNVVASNAPGGGFTAPGPGIGSSLVVQPGSISIPEPSSLLALGLVAGAVVLRRRRD